MMMRCMCVCEESFRVIAKEEGEEKYLISLGLSRKGYFNFNNDRI